MKPISLDDGSLWMSPGLSGGTIFVSEVIPGPRFANNTLYLGPSEVLLVNASSTSYLPYLAVIQTPRSTKLFSPFLLVLVQPAAIPLPVGSSSRFDLTQGGGAALFMGLGEMLIWSAETETAKIVFSAGVRHRLHG